MPEALYETLSIYLLLAIGLKGGIELSKQNLSDVLAQVAMCVAVSAAIPLLVMPVLKRIGLSGVDSAALAAHYGSVSVVTFAVATTYLTQHNIRFEQHAALWVAVMEAPGIVTGIVLARLQLKKSDGGGKAAWGKMLHEITFGKSIVLLMGGLFIGAYMGSEGTQPILPLFSVLFKGVLALFLLELGLVAGARMQDLKRYGWGLLFAGILIPVCLASLGTVLGHAAGLSMGGTALFATLCASASYIAAPTALRLAVPQANAGLSITVAIGISFPFNIAIGIPLYLKMAQFLVN